MSLYSAILNSLTVPLLTKKGQRGTKLQNIQDYREHIRHEFNTLLTLNIDSITTIFDIDEIYSRIVDDILTASERHTQI